jgi:hypothetical protein
MTKEELKFSELVELCSRDGFIHAYSYLCHRDCTVSFLGGLKSEDLHYLSSPERLNKNELSTLHGLMLKSGYSTQEISSKERSLLVDSADKLLKEIHGTLNESCNERFTLENMKLAMGEFFSEPSMIRESVFYSAEQAFDFQFATLAVERYKEDSTWLQDNIGFDIEEAYSIYRAANKILSINIEHINLPKDLSGKTTSYLQFNEIPLEQLIKISNQPKEKVIKFLVMFSTNLDDDNISFNSIDDFNIINAKPVININDTYYLFQLTALAQSLYESPIFWMRENKTYRKFADEHRGNFTEEFTYKKLVSVFGKENVYLNIDIFKNASEKVGEIDILAKFGSKYLIVQAKSKGMTLSSRKGQVELVKDDFTKAFQKAYDQAIDCSNALMSQDVYFKDADGNELVFEDKPTSCYPVCITSESYPSLTFQCRQHLKYKQADNLKYPFILDVFFLDILTEFLSQPLFFLSYVDRRTTYIEALMASTEIVILSMHLQRNLWIEDDIDLMYLHDDIASDLDAAFMVRRLGWPGNSTPQGIIQKYTSGFIGKLLFKIQRTANDDLTDLGFTLLKGNGKFVNMLNSAVEKIQYSTIQDGLTHDFSIQLEGETGGLTVHTISGDLETAQKKLLKHIHARKYASKQSQWFGILVEPNRLGLVSAICKLSFPWEKNNDMELAVQKLNITNIPRIDSAKLKKNLKIKLQRNDKCLCGSGKKYKKCCMNKTHHLKKIVY